MRAQPPAPAQKVVADFLSLSKEDQKLVLLEVLPNLFRRTDRRELLRFMGQVFNESAEEQA